MKGSYVVLIKVEDTCNLPVGGLGKVAFNRGYYAYVGSALNNLEKRIHRHMSAEKKIFWHIDYLLEKAEVIDVLYVESAEKLECGIVGLLSRTLKSVPGFGCSDCSCRSHLFYHKNSGELQTVARGALAQICGPGNIHEYKKR